MIARLAKNANSARRLAESAAAAAPQLVELDVADACVAPIAPAEPDNELDRLYAALEAVTPENHPRTARLLGSSIRKMAQKVIEEAGEVALAAAKHNRRNVVRESADLLYQLAVLWRRTGTGPQEIWAEMRRRADMLGIAEKLPKSPG